MSRPQTITSFLLNPFNKRELVDRENEYNTKYREYINNNNILLHAICIIEDSYYYHLRIPSESMKNGNYSYDVVIRFYTDDPVIQRENHLRNYFVQFYSNSPSFMYQYAYLYKKEGFLIEELYSKIGSDFLNNPPEKANKNMIVSYDKSIYFVCRFLTELSHRVLYKKGPNMIKQIPPEKFFRDISDFKSVRMDQALLSEEKKLSNIVKNKNPRSSKKNEDSKKGVFNKIAKKKPTKSTSQNKSIVIKTKKTAAKSTRKR